MYYKITNKDSRVYKELFDLRTKEIRIEEDNEKALKDKIGLDWDNSLGNHGQQNIRRVTQYSGFEFTEPEKVDQKIWVAHKEHRGVFVPNKRTKKGKEMYEFLMNGLKGSNYNHVFEILDLDVYGRFSLPYVFIAGETIIFYVGEDLEPKDENLIEITKKEFHEIFNNCNEENK